MTALQIAKYAVTVALVTAGAVSENEQRGRVLIALGCIITASMWLFMK